MPVVAVLLVGGTLAACAGTSSEPSAPIATAGTAADTAADIAAEGDAAGDDPAVVEIRPVLSTTVGFCEDFGVGMRLDGRRCHLLGAPLDLGGDAGRSDWVTEAVAEPRGDLGWVVRVQVTPDAFATVRDAFEAAAADRYVLVADGRGMLEFGYAALAQEAALGPLLSEREALTVAAVLRGEPRPDLDRPSADVGDVWLAALGVHVCGEWLANAPATALEAGVHSHGDGLVHVHPVNADGPDRDTGDDATLGRFLAEGGWRVDEDGFAVWDGVDVRTGDTCPDGREGVFRWTVDGEDGSGDPSEHRVGHRQVIVLSFDPIGTDPGEPPQLASLPLPVLGPDFAPAGG
ncbi:MAG: hypothetical protein NTZ21_01700 [Actinobacteria bacterium]|nr:hypothetical protein [Actinomycetota bacterium]